MPVKTHKYDKTNFFKELKFLSLYDVGEAVFYIHENKILEGHIVEINFREVESAGHYSLKVYTHVKVSRGDSGVIVETLTKNIFKTKEEAADKFLQDNDVPAELLRVLKQDKPKTTVGDLITQLNAIDPETDLEGYYWRIVKDIQAVYLDKIGVEVNSTSDYWDCECERRYIHPASDEICPHCKAERTNQPDSRISEIKPENMFYPQRGE